MIKNLIENRREMRIKRNAVIRKSPIAMIDVGSSKITTMIAQFIPSEDEISPPSFRILSACEFASHGVQYGEITAMSQLESDIFRSLQTVQKRANVRVDYAVACFSGGRPQSFGVSGETTVVSGEVANSDIGAAMSNCEFPELFPGREFLHALPVNFTLDHRTGLHDPRNQIGASLAVDMHMLSVDSAVLHNLHQVVRRADMELIDVSVSPYMSGIAVLTEDEQNLGSVVIDMGAMTTSVAVFLRKQLIFVKTIRLGGYHVTNDIVHGLRVGFQAAERMKTLHGGIEATAADDRETIELEGGEYSDRRYATRAELIGVIRPRLEEIFEELQKVFAEAGVDYMPSQRVVITGGASQIPGLEVLAERYLGRRVRIGRTIRLPGAATNQSSPSFAALSGLAVHTAMPRDELWDFETLYDAKSSLSVKNMFSWFRENW